MTYLYAREAWKRISRLVAIGRLSALRFAGRTPDRLIVAPSDLRAADPYIAEEFTAGRISLGGRLLDTEGESPFRLELPSREFAARLHGFSWLRHVRAAQSEVHSAHARRVVAEWLDSHGRRMVGIAWEVDIVAQRVIAWLSHSPVVLKGADIGFYRRFLKSLAVQVRFLKHMAPHAPDGEVRMRCRIALAIASLAMPASQGTIRRAARKLDAEIERQILADGGHVSRNPRVGLELLLDLLPLRQTYVNLGHDVPLKLIPTIDRMFPALRFFRHQGGELALFNGATTTLANELMSVLRYDETGGLPFKSLPHLHYHRLAVKDVVLIMDTGKPMSLELSASAHAGCLSFEMSSGRYRFIINSGAPRFAGEDFRQLARSTAAHSTAVLNDTSSSRMSKSAWLGPIIVSGVACVDVSRQESHEGAEGVTASHDGYVRLFGLVHERSIAVNSAGTLIRGRDRFIAADGSDPGEDDVNRAVIRFHIHPQIELHNIDDHEISLVAPDGETWLFSTLDAPVVIEEDVFFADPSGIRASQQIEIAFTVGEVPEVQWVLQKKG